MAGHDQHDEQESRRILKQVDGEMQPGGLVQRTSERLQDHLAASDVDAHDPIEQWGTRIGRTIGALVTIAVIAWAIYVLMNR